MTITDFVIESFPPRFMDKLGLGYDSLSQLNRGIIMVSITPFGQTGPHAGFSALGLALTGLAGFPEATGWPDRNPLPLPMA